MDLLKLRFLWFFVAGELLLLKKRIGKTSLFYLLTHTFVLFVRNQVQNPNKGNRLVYAATILFLPNNRFVGTKNKKNDWLNKQIAVG